MKKNFLTVLAILICFQFATAQIASDVLENGIHVKSDNALFLKYDEKDKSLKFAIAKSKDDIINPIKPIPLEDSTIFMVAQSALPTYLLPLNPLNYSYTTENKIITDPVNEAAIVGLNSIFDVLKTIPKPPAPPAPLLATVAECDSLFDYLDSTLKVIQTKLGDNKKVEINSAFNRLKALTFLEYKPTADSLNAIKTSIGNIVKYFKDMQDLIDNTNAKVKKYKCGNPDLAFTVKYIFTNILKELSAAKDEQKKRLDNLQANYDLVEKAKKVAQTGADVDGLRWCIKLDDIQSKTGKISVYTLTIKESGYKLSDKN